ncbi:MAG: VanZ family protein [Muribaculaceae bacterium]|nr:VanZ family protein [Muribaculaceae bacterium]
MCKSGDKSNIKRLQDAMRKVPDWLLSSACLLLILWLTLFPHPFGDKDFELFEGADKLIHGIMFFGLTLCLLFDAKRSKGWKRMQLPLIGGLTLVGMLIGMGIEFLQPMCGRSFEFMDMGADAFGAVLAGASWTLIDGALTIYDREEGKDGRNNGKTS